MKLGLSGLKIGQCIFYYDCCFFCTYYYFLFPKFLFPLLFLVVFALTFISEISFSFAVSCCGGLAGIFLVFHCCSCKGRPFVCCVELHLFVSVKKPVYLSQQTG